MRAIPEREILGEGELGESSWERPQSQGSDLLNLLGVRSLLMRRLRIVVVSPPAYGQYLSGVLRKRLTCGVRRELVAIAGSVECSRFSDDGEFTQLEAW